MGLRLSSLADSPCPAFSDGLVPLDVVAKAVEYLEVPAYLASEVVGDLGVPGHGRALPGSAVYVDGVAGPLPEKLAALCL